MRVTYDAKAREFTLVVALGQPHESKSGKTIVLAQGTDKQSGLLEAFGQVGASVSVYAWPKTA